MKTKLILLIALAISTAAFADVNPSVTVVAQSKHVFKLIYKSQNNAKVQVTIFNSRNEVVFNETINETSNFTRPYNFSQLPEGEYTIEVKDDAGKKIERVNYMNGAIQSIISVSKLVNAPSKYMLTAVNEGENAINVTILNAVGDTLYNETLSVNGNFGVIYNLLEEGNYTFIVSDKSGKTKTINY